MNPSGKFFGLFLKIFLIFQEKISMDRDHFFLAVLEKYLIFRWDEDVFFNYFEKTYNHFKFKSHSIESVVEISSFVFNTYISKYNGISSDDQSEKNYQWLCQINSIIRKNSHEIEIADLEDIIKQKTESIARNYDINEKLSNYLIQIVIHELRSRSKKKKQVVERTKIESMKQPEEAESTELIEEKLLIFIDNIKEQTDSKLTSNTIDEKFPDYFKNIINPFEPYLLSSFLTIYQGQDIRFKLDIFKSAYNYIIAHDDTKRKLLPLQIKIIHLIYRFGIVEDHLLSPENLINSPLKLNKDTYTDTRDKITRIIFPITYNLDKLEQKLKSYPSIFNNFQLHFNNLREIKSILNYYVTIYNYNNSKILRIPTDNVTENRKNAFYKIYIKKTIDLVYTRAQIIDEFYSIKK